MYQCKVQHLLRRDVRDLALPAGDCLQLPVGQPLVGALLERERGEQVLAHDGVFELGRFAQHVDERFTVLYHEWRLWRG
jgi:hypothetical protein